MKAKEAPKKLYITYKGYGVFDEDSSVERTNDSQTEYTRIDTFIDKADKWLSLNLKMLMNVLDVEYDTHDTDIKDFIEDFKKYMSE